MFASLLRARNAHRRRNRSSYSSHFGSPQPGRTSRRRSSGQQQSDYEEALTDEDQADEHGNEDVDQLEDDEEDEVNEEEDGEETQLLPLFSSEHLDTLPIYSTTHAIRILVVQKCETTLSWDQLRSPQISTFLVKPIQQQILAKHLSPATLYALLANGLQFLKEGQMYPGNVGVSKTRALMCELLAMRLLKEFSTRELIDALSYDFHPLQGADTALEGENPQRLRTARSKNSAFRISTLEIAIRAEAKRFIAHPLVVQHLEAIWAGKIVFHIAADSLHRSTPRPPIIEISGSYGTISNEQRSAPPFEQRRSVTMYDPGDASIFKLSRLRVPRYRQIFSTLSFAVMLSLFLAVLVERHVEITLMESIFWFWSGGFILDEIAGFTEQGFGLYMLSVWNALDVGILACFITYYVLRLFSVVAGEGKREIADLAYDVLAATSVLLFPRLFSVLDHVRYFSQILIAFRMMFKDLMAIVCLILVACSGFFVIFSLSFGGRERFTPGFAAYSLFQILMGYSPAAWEVWDSFNFLGKAMLVCYLVLSHFVIVTILVTVMTNSFMAIVQNAEHEHLYLFAVNTISMVKGEALFSYLAPSNIIGWFLAFARYLMPFRRYVRLNRTVIKVTHLPILFSIFAYEKLVLAQFDQEPLEQIERGRSTARTPAFSIKGPADLASPGARLRDRSITTNQKDRALEEVFRRPFRDPSTATRDRQGAPIPRRSSHVVHDWMRDMGDEGGASSPIEQPRSVLDRLETQRNRQRWRENSSQNRRRISGYSASVASEPEDLRSHLAVPHQIAEEDELLDMSFGEEPQATDADGDDEATSDRETPFENTPGHDGSGDRKEHQGKSSAGDYFSIPKPRKPSVVSNSLRSNEQSSSGTVAHVPTEGVYSSLQSTEFGPPRHRRQISTNTILYNPRRADSNSNPINTTGLSHQGILSDELLLSETPDRQSSEKNAGSPVVPTRAVETQQAQVRANVIPVKTTVSPPKASATALLVQNPQSRSTSDLAQLLEKPKLIRQTTTGAIPPKNRTRKAWKRQAGRSTERQDQSPMRGPPSFAALDLASDIGDNRYGPDAGVIGIMPASFSTAQMAYAGFGRDAFRGSGFQQRYEKQKQQDPKRDPFARGRAGDSNLFNSRFQQSTVAGPSDPKARRTWQDAEDNDDDDDGDNIPDRSGEAGMVSRIMLARMNNLEEGFREILSEVRDLRRERLPPLATASGGATPFTANFITAQGATGAATILPSRSLASSLPSRRASLDVSEDEGTNLGAQEGAKKRRKRRPTGGRTVLKGERIKERDVGVAQRRPRQEEGEGNASGKTTGSSSRVGSADGKADAGGADDGAEAGVEAPLKGDELEDSREQA